MGLQGRRVIYAATLAALVATGCAGGGWLGASGPGAATGPSGDAGGRRGAASQRAGRADPFSSGFNSRLAHQMQGVLEGEIEQSLWERYGGSQQDQSSAVGDGLAPCDEPAREMTPPTGPASSAESGDLSLLAGVYRVRGRQQGATPAMRRRVTGHVVIREMGGEYSSSYSLRTQYQNKGKVTSGELIGRGMGRRHGDRLVETTYLQVVTSAVAGVDVMFPFVPRKVGPRVSSRTVANVEPDGAIVLVIESSELTGDHGQAALVTRLEGHRIEETEWPERVRNVAFSGGESSLP